MADPTLKDVLDAIVNLDAKVARLESGQARHERRFDALDQRFDTLEKGQAGLDVKVREGFANVDKRFDELDAELTLHAKVHREIEKDITALKARPPRTAARPARRGASK